MHFIGIDKHGRASMVHDGVPHEFSIGDWHHPDLIAGHPELGKDESLLVSKEVEDENGRHTVFVPIDGDADAQALHVAHRHHHGKQSKQDAIAEVRGHIERRGGHYRLNEDGERHTAPLLPYVPPEAPAEPEEQPPTEQEIRDFMTRIMPYVQRRQADGNSDGVRGQH